MKKIYLIDGNSFIYRMFFALPEFATKDGKIVNAIFGMAKFFVGQLIKENPDYIIFVKDAKGENFRHELYSDYKATRDRMPDNLRVQIDDIEKMIGLMGVPIVEIPGYEADDVIGTLAVDLGKISDYEIDILTGDKDLYSLVSENVKIYDTMKKKKFGPEETKEKFGIEANMIIDYLAIVGDKADNIPGIEGFGPKKAIDLINIVGGVEDIYDLVLKVENSEIEIFSLDKSIQSIFKGKTFEKLISSRENAFLSKKLATIACDVPLCHSELDSESICKRDPETSSGGQKEFDIENFSFNPEKILNDEVKDYFKSLEFNSLIGEEDKKLKKWNDLNLKVQIIGDKQGLDDLEKTLEKYDEIVFDTETTSLDIIEAELVGISLYLDDKNIYYINRLHDGPKVTDNYLKDFINNLFNSDRTLIAHNLKYDLEILELFLKNDKKESNLESKGQMSLLQ